MMTGTEETTWFDDMTRDEIKALGKKINAQEFDHVFQITSTGVIDGPGNVWAPEIFHDDDDDISIDQMQGHDWQALKGYTGQYGYSGTVMHPSEFIGGGIASDMIEMSATAEAEGRHLLWCVVVCEVLPDDDDDDPEPAGWVVCYMER